jgi:LysM repeat protein
VRRPLNPVQQVLTGLAVLLLIIATLLGGVVLALGDRSRQDIADAQPTSTPFRIATLPLTGVSERTQIPTQTRAPTVIVIPTSTRSASTPIPTRTARPATDTNTPAPAPTSTPCSLPTGWVDYIVQSGDTLFSIGLRYGLTVDEMMKANCLTDERIDAGDVLRVPPVTPRATTFVTPAPTNGIPIKTATSGPTGTQTATDGACTSHDSVITFPEVGAKLSGIVQIRGTVRLVEFAFYKLEIRREGASTSRDYKTFFTGEVQVTNGMLASLNTAEYADGEYWVRLVVVDSTGNYPERCAILYLFDN